MEISEKLREFIESSDFKDSLENNDFTKIYLRTSRNWPGSDTGTLTELFYKFDIDPLDDLTYIPAYYNYGREIQTFQIHSNITSIGWFAFCYCSKLTSITIPNSVTSIGDSAFADCHSLTSITIPDSVTDIGNSAFWNCQSLSRITIGNGVNRIGDTAFQWCEGLRSIHYTGTRSQWNDMSTGFRWDSHTGDYTVHCTDGDIQKR